MGVCYHIRLSKIPFIYRWPNPAIENPSIRKAGYAENWPGTLCYCPWCPFWWPLSRQTGKGQPERPEEWHVPVHLSFLPGFRARTWAQGWPPLVPKLCHRAPPSHFREHCVKRQWVFILCQLQRATASLSLTFLMPPTTGKLTE